MSSFPFPFTKTLIGVEDLLPLQSLVELAAAVAAAVVVPLVPREFAVMTPAAAAAAVVDVP